MNSIKTENLTYTYGVGTPFVKTAIDHVDLEIAEGEFVGLIGHTGSGKSTLIKHFNGLMKPTEGRVFIDGEDIWAEGADRKKIRFKVGLVFQYPEYQLFEETVYKDIAFGPKNIGYSEQEIDESVREAAEMVGLTPDLLEKSPFELSGGQKRRVAIAGVLAMRPRILILDEPAAGLDPRGRDEILARVREYHQQKKSTVVLVSHSMEDVTRYATRVLCMRDAKIAMYGTVDEIFSHSEHLAEIGLGAPQITDVMIGLRARGIPVDTGIYTVDAAERELRRLLQGGERLC
ncbi:energy-coupling factor transporter ATPase [Feifania hominis]|uniref:Energy-coupling factor transporter ATP-binding protein EcfA2 n=1 Tax=Feifania hominis TaxID=2763660 RepID=A0A926DC16_9FIRM|nr:energy-coupling factor transporter ATPase [Feifania hominis]MBC8535456.1 energy-coupling factor transporter ATPase [Feifania hominis]